MKQKICWRSRAKSSPMPCCMRAVSCRMLAASAPESSWSRNAISLWMRQPKKRCLSRLACRAATSPKALDCPAVVSADWMPSKQ